MNKTETSQLTVLSALSEGCNKCGQNHLKYKIRANNVMCVRCGEIKVANFFKIQTEQLNASNDSL